MVFEKEIRINDINNRIQKNKQEIADLNDNTWVYAVAVIGAILLLAMGIGLLVIIADIVWVILREREVKQLDQQVFDYESELSRLQGI